MDDSVRDERGKWLTVEQVAYIWRTTRQWVSRAIHAGHIPVVAVGRRYRIHMDDLPKCQKAVEEWSREQNFLPKRTRGTPRKTTYSS